MSLLNKAPWQNPSPFSFMHPVERVSHRGKPSSYTVSAPLVSWPVRSQSPMAARVSSPSTSIKRVSPLRRLTALQRTCFASPQVQNQNLQRSNSEEQEKMRIASWRYLARTAGLMWCSSALAPSLASKWPSTYGVPLSYSPLLRSTDVVLGTFWPIQTAIAGGKVMLVGMGTRNTALPLSAAAVREVDIHGSFRYANTYPEALDLLASGTLQNLDKLITHRFGLSDTARAFDLLTRGVDERGDMVLKVMIRSEAPPSRH